MNKKLVATIALILVLAGMISTVLVNVSASWYDLSWTRRKPVTMDNTLNPNSLVDYQVKIDVDYDSDMNSDFSDLRFTDSDEVTLIPYWIEDYTASVSADVWVKIPSVPASDTKTIYMYYGNSAATSESNGDAVFEFFDDFNDGIWTDRWTNPNPQGTYTESGGLMKLQSTGYSSLDSIESFTGPVIIESRTRRFTGYDYYTRLREVGKDNTVESGIANYGRYFTIRRMGTDFGSELPLFLDSSSNEWKEFRGLLHDNLWHVYRGDVLDNWDRDDSLPLEASADGRVYYVQIFTHEAGDSGAYWDWVRGRKYTSPEPTVTIEPEELATVSATIDIDPDTLNLKSNGQWITAYITLPEGYNMEDIDLETVELEDIPAAWSEIQDGVYMAKFDRTTVRDALTEMIDYEQGVKFYDMTLTVTGNVAGTPFEGSDTITVIKK